MAIKLIKFSTVWCGPCKTYDPIFDEFVTENGLIYEKIDCDARPDTMQAYNIRGVPTTVVVKDGVEIGRASGVLSKSALQSLVSAES